MVNILCLIFTAKIQLNNDVAKRKYLNGGRTFPNHMGISPFVYILKSILSQKQECQSTDLSDRL